MFIDSSGSDVFVSKQLLNVFGFGAVFHQMCCEGMAQGVGGENGSYFRFLTGLLDDFFYSSWGYMSILRGK